MEKAKNSVVLSFTEIYAGKIFVSHNRNYAEIYLGPEKRSIIL
jgi:hypothetical protein